MRTLLFILLLINPSNATSVGSSGPFHVDVTMASFEKEVLLASRDCIVLLDFWADWCVPCKQFSPILKKIVQTSGGKIKLAKVNLQGNQALANQLKVDSIPTVCIYAQGKRIDTFVGKISEQDLKNKLAPVYKLLGMVDESDFEEKMSRACKFYNEGNYKHAATEFGRALSLKPKHFECLAGMAHCYLFLGQTLEAKVLAQKINMRAAAPCIVSLRHHFKLLEETQHLLAKVSSSKQKEQDKELHHLYETGLKDIIAARFEHAVENFLKIIRTKQSEDKVRRLLFGLFEALGQQHTLTVSGRQKLEMHGFL